MKTSWMRALAAPLLLVACDAGRPSSDGAPTLASTRSVEASVEPTAEASPKGAPPEVETPPVDTDTEGPTAVAGSVVPKDDPAFKKIPDADDPAWKNAPPLAMARSPKDCEARVLGRFVRIRCEAMFASYSESLAGEPETVRYAHQDAKWSVDYRKKLRDTSRAAVFSLAPGERRVMQFADLNGGWRFPWTASTDAVISAYWLEDEAGPTVVID